MDEQEFLARLSAGDEKAFSMVFRTYYETMYQFARKFLPSNEEAEDITENTFLKLLEDNTRFNDRTHLKSYLFRAIRHACLNARKTSERAAQREAIFAEWHAENDNDYLAQIAQSEAVFQLRQAVAGLPNQAQRVITLTYLAGLSNQETADELGISLQTVKNQKLRALALLRSRLTADQFSLLIAFASIAGQKNIWL